MCETVFFHDFLFLSFLIESTFCLSCVIYFLIFHLFCHFPISYFILKVYCLFGVSYLHLFSLSFSVSHPKSFWMFTFNYVFGKNSVKCFVV